MNQTVKVVVVIPAYNEAQTIREIAVGAREHVVDVVVVDDGSTDHTSEALSGLPVTLLQNLENEGKAGALWRGMQYALKLGATGVITLDGDGQHRPEDIPRLIDMHRTWPDALVIAARMQPVQSAPRLRRFANRFADFWISWTAGHWIFDSQSGFRLYPAKLLKQLNVMHDRAHSFVFESEAVIEAVWQGFPLLRIAVPALYPTASRPSHFRPIVDVARIVIMVTKRLVERKLHPLGLLRALRERARIRRGGGGRSSY